jgi:hypothetical protein
LREKVAMEIGRKMERKRLGQEGKGVEGDREGRKGLRTGGAVVGSVVVSRSQV